VTGVETTFRSASELPALVSYLRERRCVLFVGAGLSRPAGYPGWGELMRTVVDATADQLGEAAGRDELERLLKQAKFAEVADQCRTVLGRTHFGQILRTVLARDVAPPEATHRAIVDTPYACIVTTNFDTLLEDAFARWSDFGIPKAPTGMELAQHGTLLLDGAFFILKAHGTIHDDDSMVFTSEDYRRITHANPAFQAVMSSLLLTHAVLFVGYSLSDPNFRLLLDSQLSTFGSEAPPRYAFMENVGAAEKAILRRTAGIEVISFAQGAYGEVGELLNHLAQAIRSDAPLVAPGPAEDVAARPRKLLREVGREPAFVVRIQARDVMVDSTWYATTTSDLVGASLPLEAMHTTTSTSPAWHELQQLVGPCVDTPFGAHVVDTVERVGRILSQSVPGVEHDLASLPPDASVVLDVDPGLAALPWEWMQTGAASLALQHPVCRTMPGLPDASRGRPLVRNPLRALLIGDTLAESVWHHPLHDARAEVEALALQLTKVARGSDVTVLTGRNASYARVLQELRTGRYDLVHFAGVSHYDESGSYLMLHDGKVGAAELVTLLIKRPPALLVLNALYSGFVPVFCQAFPLTLRHGTSYDDHYRALARHRIGFERAAARAGVGTFVGVMGTSGDRAAGRLALAFYGALLAGRNAAQALLDARRRVFAADDSTAMQFAMSGYADLRLLPKRRPAATKRKARPSATKRKARPSATKRKAPPSATKRKAPPVSATRRPARGKPASAARGAAPRSKGKTSPKRSR